MGERAYQKVVRGHKGVCVVTLFQLSDHAVSFGSDGVPCTSPVERRVGCGAKGLG